MIASGAPQVRLVPGAPEDVTGALAVAAHELRIPATILSGIAVTLQRRLLALNDGTVNDLLEAMQRQTRVLDRITADLLTSVQCRRGVVSVDVQPMLLAPVLHDAARAWGGREPLAVSCPADLWVTGDSVRLAQMLGNLLSNALKYGAPPVEISAVRAAPFAQVRVLDRGPGVPADLRPRLFEQYGRADGRRAGGTGLGLYVVSSLAVAQGGSAWYDALPGSPTSFCFSLPLDTAREECDAA